MGIFLPYPTLVIGISTALGSFALPWYQVLEPIVKPLMDNRVSLDPIPRIVVVNSMLEVTHYESDDDQHPGSSSGASSQPKIDIAFHNKFGFVPTPMAECAMCPSFSNILTLLHKLGEALSLLHWNKDPLSLLTASRY